MYKFLHELTLSQESKEKLYKLGADSAPALLGMIYAAPEAMVEYIGIEEAEKAKEGLKKLLSPSEKQILDKDVISFPIGKNI